MANTTAQRQAEQWIINEAFPKRFPSVSFTGKKMKLTWGGHFEFDAVSDNHSIVIAISTSEARTASGKLATAKFQKLKTDALYLLHLEVEACKIMVFTEESMCNHFKQESSNGRFPPSSSIQLLHFPLPENLQRKVVAARKIASDETSPSANRKDVS